MPSCASPLAREANDAIAETLPTPSPDEAARELERAVKELELDGATIFYGGFHAELDAMFATVGLGRHFESGIQVIRLILAGMKPLICRARCPSIPHQHLGNVPRDFQSAVSAPGNRSGWSRSSRRETGASSKHPS